MAGGLGCLVGDNDVFVVEMLLVVLLLVFLLLIILMHGISSRVIFVDRTQCSQINIINREVLFMSRAGE